MGLSIFKLCLGDDATDDSPKIQFKKIQKKFRKRYIILRKKKSLYPKVHFDKRDSSKYEVLELIIDSEFADNISECEYKKYLSDDESEECDLDNNEKKKKNRLHKKKNLKRRLRFSNNAIQTKRYERKSKIFPRFPMQEDV
jgi:hypothetical protein